MIRLAIAALLLTASPALAEVTVTQPWARATPPGAQTGAVYLTLTSPAADTLVAVATPAAKTAELHEMTMEGDVMRMRELPQGIPLPAGTPVTLTPGGNHVMLMGLPAPLKQGGTIRLHLTFEHASPIDVTAKIAGIGATAAPR